MSRHAIRFVFGLASSLVFIWLFMGYLLPIGLPFLLSLVVVFVLFTLMNRQAGGGGGKMADFGKSKAQMIAKGQVDPKNIETLNRTIAQLSRR